MPKPSSVAVLPAADLERIRNMAAVVEASDYVPLAVAAEKLGLKTQTIKNKMSLGIYVKGVHYVKPNGGRPLFKLSALIGLS